MAYDFPASPTENQEFTPPGGTQTYIYKSPRWLVMGVPPIVGGGGGGGIDEAPVDGNQYARQDATWSEVAPSGIPEAPTTGQFFARSGLEELWAPVEDMLIWTDIQFKPATFPPTLPIPWTDVSGKPSTFPPTLPIGWSDVSGKPATFPPTLPIAQSGVNNLTTDLAAKAPLASPVLTGDPQAPTPATADNDTSIATTAHVQANMALKANATHTHPQSDVTNLTTDLAAKAPLASPVFTGNPTAPTPTAGDNDTSLATTAFVTTAIAASSGVSKSPTHWDFRFSTTTTIGSTPNGEVRFNNASWGSVTHIFVGGESLAGGDPSVIYNMLKPGSLLMLEATTSSGKWVSFLIHSVAFTGIYDLTVQYYGGGDLLLANNDLVTMQLTAAPGPIISDTAPTSDTGLNYGTLWFKSNTGSTYIWYFDGGSSQWVQVNVAPPNLNPPTAQSRNRIVNGAMQISQENGDASGAGMGAFYPADQWMAYINVSTGAATGQRVAVGTPDNSRYRIRFTVTTAEASLASGKAVEFYTILEGIRTTDFFWGSPTKTKQAVLRFGWKSPAGTYSVAINNSGATRSYIASFTIAAGQANTDTLQTLIIPGDTMGVWLQDTSPGLLFDFMIAGGPDIVGVAGWQTGPKYTTSAQTNGMATVGNVFELYDVGLYLDPDNTGLAPKWQMPDEVEELRACQRYWRLTPEIQGATISTTAFRGIASFYPPMRVSPTFSMIGTTVHVYNITNAPITGITTVTTYDDWVDINLAITGGGVQNAAAYSSRNGRLSARM